MGLASLFRGVLAAIINLYFSGIFEIRFVSVNPGDTIFTLILNFANSIANDLAGKFGQIDQSAQAQNFANKQNALVAQGTGAQGLAAIGSGLQQQAQNQADAPYKGLSQYASLFHGIADKSTTTTQQGQGGK